MPSVEAERILSELLSAKGAAKSPIAQLRREWIARAEAEPLPEGVKTSAVTAGGVLAEWVEHPDCNSDAVFLLFHGGGYSAGGPATHRRFAAYISQATNMKVMVPDYRLAPEHPFPAGVHDCLSVYGALLSDGVPARRIAFGGDSAGGGMAASTLLAMREAGVPMPSSLIMIAPWLDLTNSSPSYQSNAENDPSTSHERHAEIAPWYYDQADPKNPMISPMFADLKGFPPTLLQVGDIEVMIDDSKVFADHAKKAGVEVDLQVWPRMWHIWHQRMPDLPEAREGFDKIGAFVKKHLGRE